ncbi:MAG: TlpA family protein disulfide reductase [Telluria sp.]
MKAICSLLAACCVSVAAVPAQAVEKGAAAPAFKLPGRDGSTVSLDQLKGKTVYIDFWASWCGPCRKSFPWMNEMQSRYGGDKFAVIAIDVDSDSALARQFLAQHPASFTVAFDAKGATPQAFSVKGMPTSVLIGPDGKVLDVETGFNESQAAQREQMIRAAIGAQP